MNYNLTCKFGEKLIPLDVPNLKELTISQDLNKFLPEFRMRVVDATGELTHTTPIDAETGRVSFGFSQLDEKEKPNFMTFDTYVFLPEGDQSSPTATYDIEGLLSVSSLMSVDYSRSFSGPVSTTLETIGQEIGIGDKYIKISPTLADVELNVIQPYWNNMQLLKYLKTRLIGGGGEWGFKSYLYCTKGNTWFAFDSLAEMVYGNPAYKFILSDKGFKDQLPIYNYAIYGNSKIYTAFAGATQSYTYFDYEAEEFVVEQTAAEDYESLTDYVLIDSAGEQSSNLLVKLGRSTDFTEDYEGYAKSNYGNRLMDLVKMWITTSGLTHAYPGQVVQIFFPYGQASDDIASYQYSGDWLIEKVVHNFGNDFLTKLLLTRSGIDTDVGSSLLKASATGSIGI